MLHFHLAGRPVEKSLDYSYVAGLIEGYSASDIKFLVDEAARLALDRMAEISAEIISEVLQKVPPSITKDEVDRYLSFQERGI